MKLLSGVSDQPKQTMTLTLADGSKALWSLEYRAQQIGWFWDLSWSGQPVALGQRLVASPNILRSFINLIPFGISVITQGNVEPLNLEDLADGTTELVLLEGDDIGLVETAAFGAPAGQTQAVVIGTDGRPAVLPPAQWGPASGDLAGFFPNPRVAAAHVAGGQQVTFGDIPDGKIVKRVGSAFVGADEGGGDVNGPAGASDNHLAVFDGITGKLIKDGGSLADGSLGIFVSTAKATRFSFPLQNQTTSGSIVLNLTGANRMYVGLTGNAAFTFAGFSPEFSVRLIVENTTGGPLSLTWPACDLASGALPTSLPAGAIIIVQIEVNGTSISEVVAAMIGSSPLLPAGTYGDATHVSQFTIDANGRIVSIASVSIAATGASWFDVSDYGAVPNVVANWSPYINAAISAAVSYAAANGAATVFFPQGAWYISAEIYAQMAATGHLTIRGTGRHGSVIVQQTTNAHGIHVDLSFPGHNIKNRAEVCDLGFAATAGVAAGTAVWMDYGQAPGSSVSTPQVQGSCVHDINVNGNDSDDGPGGLWGGGYANGVHMLNCWGSFVTNCYFYGGAGWTNATPGNGAAGVGSGAAVIIQGATNFLLSNLYCQTWSQFFRIIPVNGLGGSGLVPQGVQISCFDCVTVMEMIHTYANASGDGIDWMTATNWQCDNGNDPGARTTKRGVFIEGGGNAVISDGYFLFRGGHSFVELSNCGGVDVHDVRMEDGSGGMIQSVKLSNASNGHKFLACEFGGFDINLSAGAGHNQINNTGASTVNNAGAFNRIIATVWP